jgi:predicted GTPase
MGIISKNKKISLNKRFVNILVCGESGLGKSSFIQTFLKIKCG